MNALRTGMALAAVSALGMASCTTQPYGNTTSGTLLGAGTGAAAGAIIGNNVNGLSTAEGAIGGAVLGGLVGNVMGRQQDQINAARIEANQTVVNVPNSNGSYTPVVLTRAGNGWQGPRGEFYTGVPSANQLRNLYGM